MKNKNKTNKINQITNWLKIKGKKGGAITEIILVIIIVFLLYKLGYLKVIVDWFKGLKF
jgi:uncharacterized membrane protein YvbJ